MWPAVLPASVVPPAAEAAADEERTERPQGRYRGSIAFDVFAPDGRFLGHVKTPEWTRLYPHPVFRGDTVWAVVEDLESGLLQISRMQLEFSKP